MSIVVERQVCSGCQKILLKTKQKQYIPKRSCKNIQFYSYQQNKKIKYFSSERK